MLTLLKASLAEYFSFAAQLVGGERRAQCGALVGPASQRCGVAQRQAQRSELHEKLLSSFLPLLCLLLLLSPLHWLTKQTADDIIIFNLIT